MVKKRVGSLLIGIILSARYLRNKERAANNEHVLFYMKLARKNRVDLCFYSPANVSARTQSVTGYVYSHQDDSLTRITVPIPRINLYKINSSLRNRSSNRQIIQVKEKRDVIFYNLCTKKERSKYLDYNYLKTFNSIRPLLPATETLQYDTLVNMLKKYNTVFIKPKRGGQGNRIRIIRQKGDHYTITYINKKIKREKSIAKKKLSDHFTQEFTHPSRFIVQQGISLKKYRGNKFDFRVSPQKNKDDKWQITGMIARVASAGWDVTNIDQGGRVVGRVKKLIPPQTRKEIYRKAILVARALEQRFPYLNDLGLDFAVDKEGKVWFLEANFRPNRKKAAVKRNRIPFEHVCAVYKSERRQR